jgi:hypothetical protein
VLLIVWTFFVVVSVPGFNVDTMKPGIGATQKINVHTTHSKEKKIQS